MLAVYGTKNDQGTLEPCQSPYPTHCHVFGEFLQQTLCQFTGTNSQHVVHMHSNANVQFRVRKQTRITPILNETMFFQPARQMFLPTSRRCSETQHDLTHSPNHTSAIRRNLRVPAFRWLRATVRLHGLQRSEKLVCSLPHKLRVPDLETPCQEHTDALYCC